MLNQVEDDNHYGQEIWELQSLPFDVIRQPCSFQIRNESGWGKAQFVALTEVTSFSPHKQYLMSDCLYLLKILSRKLSERALNLEIFNPRKFRLKFYATI